MSEKKFFSTKISKEQAKDTGMAMVLVLLVFGIYNQEFLYFKAALICLVIAMAFPLLYKYAAVFWFGMSHLIGTIVSKILLSLIFFIVVSPVGLVRRLLGYDTLKLKQFKKGNGSVMQKRNCTFKADDIKKPF